MGRMSSSRAETESCESCETLEATSSRALKKTYTRPSPIT